MKKGTSNNRLFVTALFMACLSGCATSELHETAKYNVDTQRADFQLPMNSLSLAAATALTLNEKTQFNSASLLASQRPRVKQEISEFELGVISGNEEEESRSLMRFSPLPTGLNYFAHGRSGFVEAGIDLFGVGSLVYWNSRFRYPYGVFPTAPYKVRLLNGRLYSGDSPYTLEMKNSDGEILTVECKPFEKIPSKVIHNKLAGKATIFHCKTSFGMNSDLWYIEDYARYISYAIYDDDGFQSRITVKDLKFN
jgi:hypothetical protein